MDDEFDLHANLDSEPLMADTPANAPASSFYKSTTFKVLVAVLIIIVIVFVVSYFWGSKTPTSTLPAPNNWAPPIPVPVPVPKTEHEKLVKTIPKNELYEVMKASDNTQQERKKGLLAQFKSVSELDVDSMPPEKASIVLSAKGIYEKLANESSYMPSKNDTQVLQYCMKLTTKTVTINPTPTVCKPNETDNEEDDDNDIIEIGKKSPLDDLDQ